MRSFVPAAMALALLSALCLTAACTIPFPGDAGSDDKSVNVGIGVPDTNIEKSYISMSAARVQLQEYIPGTEIDSYGTIPIYYIQGADLDSSGNAARWTFAVNRSTGIRLMILENGSLAEVPWGSRLSETPIQIDQVISPEELFRKNRDLIISDPAVAVFKGSELDLRDGVYTLTLASNGSIRYLLFNAATGEPVGL